MKHSDFKLHGRFRCGDGRWFVTDIGQRTIIAIRIDQAEIATYDGHAHAVIERCILDETEIKDWVFNGPPYMVAEHVFDEDSIEDCTAEM